MLTISVVAFLLTIFPQLTTAQNAIQFNIDIEINDMIRSGENLAFNYSIQSSSDQTIRFIPRIECPNAPMAMLDIKETRVVPGKEYLANYFSLTVTEDIAPQDCTASIEIISPVRVKEEKKIKIATNPSLGAEILLCRDRECKVKSKVYQKNDTLFLNFRTDAADAGAEAEIILPDRSKRKLDLPAEIAMEQTGVYKINVLTFATGFKKNQQSIPITVIEGAARVNNKRVCKNDGQCLALENAQNCPQDCAITASLKTADRKKLYAMVGMLILLVAGGIVAMVRRGQGGGPGNDVSVPPSPPATPAPPAPSPPRKDIF